MKTQKRKEKLKHIEEKTKTTKQNLSEEEINKDNCISSYLKDVSKHELLSFEEEKDLSKRIELGDEKALNKLISSNLRLVVKIATYFAKKGYNINDLIQDGNIGLMKAAQKYDYRKNVRFATYAGPWIKQTIIRSLQKTSTIKIPYRKEEIIKKAKNCSVELSQLYDREPTIEEISKETELSKDELKDALSHNLSTIPLETSINETKQFTIEDTIESDIENPMDSLLVKDLSREMKKALKSLYPKEREIIIYRFGLDNKEEKTLKNIGKKLGISTESVRQIAYKSLKKLKVNHESLANYINN